MSAPPCPDRAGLERLAAGSAPDDDPIHAHVAGCPRCGRRVARMRRENALLAEVATVAGQGPSPRRAGDDAPAGYRVRREISRGGQGVVYEALQVATRRRVALKVLRQGAFATDRQRHRFEREVELVAALRHPNIVTVYESGTDAAGRPYLAMELVDGVALDAALAGAPVDVVLALFADVCEAVAAAHRRGIIHRDLKPANVLVDADGAPHILDFGLAKVVDADAAAAATVQTVAGEFLGTFAYAAPEQVAADPALLDTRADVYALGVMLYEQLAGRRPHVLSGSLADVVATITDEIPPHPRRFRPDLDEDAAAITLKALEKDPDRRYQTAQAMARDLRRAGRGEAVEARADERWYVLSRTVRRHRGPVALAAGMFLAVTAAAIVMALLYGRAERANARRAQAMSGFLATILKTDLEDPEAPLPAANILELLDEASEIVAEVFGAFPEDEAAAREALGLSYMSYDRFDDAGAHFDAALALRRAAGADQAALAETMHLRARLDWNVARYVDAERGYRAALGAWRAVERGDGPKTARALQHLGATLRARGRFDEARAVLAEGLAMRRRLYGDRSPSVATILHNIGNWHRDIGRPRVAIAAYRASQDIIAGTTDFRLARSWHNVASCFITLGRLDEADRELQRSERRKAALGRGENDLAVASAHHERARLLRARGEPVAATALATRALAVRRLRYARPHPDQADTLGLLALLALDAGRAGEAETLLTEAIAIRTATQGADHWAVAVDESRLAEAEWRQGRGATGVARAAAARLADVLDARAPALRKARERVDRLTGGG